MRTAELGLLHHQELYAAKVVPQQQTYKNFNAATG